VKTTTFAPVAESSVPNSEIKPERQRTVPPSASKALPIAIAVAEPSAQIPESLRNPSESTAIHAPVTKLAALALNKVLEPVLLTEEAARDLLVQQVLPAYPESALRAHVEGAVVLQAWVGKDGVIRDVKVIRGPLLLGRAAFEAVKQWRYKPYYLNGQAVEVLTMVTLRFRLPS
jgi:TonB family protein